MNFKRRMVGWMSPAAGAIANGHEVVACGKNMQKTRLQKDSGVQSEV